MDCQALAVMCRWCRNLHWHRLHYLGVSLSKKKKASMSQAPVRLREVSNITIAATGVMKSVGTIFWLAHLSLWCPHICLELLCHSGMPLTNHCQMFHAWVPHPNVQRHGKRSFIAKPYAQQLNVDGKSDTTVDKLFLSYVQRDQSHWLPADLTDSVGSLFLAEVDSEWHQVIFLSSQLEKLDPVLIRASTARLALPAKVILYKWSQLLLDCTS